MACMAIKITFIRSINYFPKNCDNYIEELMNRGNVFTTILKIWKNATKANKMPIYWPISFMCMKRSCVQCWTQKKKRNVKIYLNDAI